MKTLRNKGRSVRQIAGLSLLTVSLGLAAVHVAPAQTDTGRVVGSITDPTGAIIPGATITITNTDTAANQTVTADDSGNFTFPALPRGNYKVSASKTGFDTTTQTFDLQVSAVQTVNLKLAVGSESTVVNVTDAAPLVDAATSSVGEVIEGRQVTELPLNGRNFTQLALLTPGVTRGNYGNGASGVGGDAETFRNSTNGGGSLSSNGLRPQANNFELDGVDNNESLVNTLDFFPNIEGTQEFRVNTSTAPAEFGRAGGSIVQSSIKSGTNQIHGSAFYFARSSLFDASPNYRFEGAGVAPVLPFKRNTFGGSLGGPILKDKLFLFGDYQGERENQPLNPEIVTVPTARMRTGDFSELLGQTVNGSSVTQTPSICGVAGVTTVAVVGGIYDPTTCQQFQGNRIPQNRLNQAAVNYLNAYPLPNITGLVNGTENNYRTIRTDIRHTNRIDARADYNITDADRLFARFIYDNSNFNRTSRFATLPAGFASGVNYVHARGYALGETHTFSPNIVNEFRAGYNRYTLANQPVDSNIPISANLGIVNANRTSNLGGGALIGGYQNQLEYTGDYGTYIVPENTYQLNDGLTYTRGRHTFKFGGSGIRRDVSFFRPIAGKGYFQIGNGDFTGYEVSELLAGFVDNYSIGSQTGLFGTRNYEVGAYVQDDWKVSQRLTLNLGARYEIITYPTEEHNRQAALNPTTGFIDLAGQNGVPQSIENSRYNNFSPRVGFAYDTTGTGKTILRGGYGIFYFLDRGGIDNQLGQQVPYGGSTTYAAQNGYRITFTGQNARYGALTSTTATGQLPQPGYVNFDRTNPPAGINVIAVPRDQKLPTVQQYDLQVQQQFGARTVMTLGYVGNLATHLATGYNYNTRPFGSTGPVAFPNLGQVVYNVNDGVSHYNSLQAQLNYRVARSLTFTSSYTWSHNIDNTNGYIGFYAVSDLYFYNHALNKGNSALDQRNVFVTSAVYDLPFGKGRQFAGNASRPVELLIGGWQLNTVVQAYTGSPFSVEFPVYGGSVSPRADIVAPVTFSHSITGTYFNTAAFSPVQPVNRQGTSGRNQFYGPGVAEGDVSLFKTLHFTERFGTELRAEVFNVTNTPQFTNPDGNPQDGNFGRVTATREYSERQMQMAVRFLF